MSELPLPGLDDSDDESPSAPPATARTQHAPAAASARAKRWRPGTRWLLKIVLEMVLIGGGVFLGLVGEQWRENAHNREVAEASLRRIRAEIVTNRSAVAAVADYHVRTMKDLRAYLTVPVGKRRPADLHVEGIRSVFFEHTAWDLALLTQSLAYVDSELAFALSRVYNVQETYERLTSGITQAMYLQNPIDNLDAFAGALALYYGDISMIEPKLLEMYDQVIGLIDQALNKRV